MRSPLATLVGVTRHGRSDIASGLKDLLAGPFKGTRISLRPIRIRTLAAHFAVEEAAFSVTGFKDPDGGSIPAVTGLCLAVYGKAGEQ